MTLVRDIYALLYIDINARTITQALYKKYLLLLRKKCEKIDYF